MRFHPNSLYLATGSSDWTARLWDVQRGTCVRVFIGHQGTLSTLAISPDGRYLASAGEDLAINLWDLGSGRRIKKMTGHTASIYSLAFSAESSLLISGGADWTVRCWDVKNAGNQGKPRQNGTEEPSPLRAGEESNETYGKFVILYLSSHFTTGLTSLQPFQRSGHLSSVFSSRPAILVWLLVTISRPTRDSSSPGFAESMYKWCIEMRKLYDTTTVLL